MSSRKATPDVLVDVLADVLGGAVGSEPVPGDVLPVRAPAAKPRQAAAGKAGPGKASRVAGDRGAGDRGAAPAAPSRRAEPDTVTWEYLEVVYRDYRGWRARVVNGKELGDWKGSPVLIDHLKQLGEEGWELVSMGDRYNNHKEAYFKRPKR